MGDMAAVDDILAAARTRIAPRVAPADLDTVLASQALVVDIRPGELRRRDGPLEGAVVVERTVLEWRLDPTSPHRLDRIHSPDQRVVIVCDEGYASSLAAAVLRDLGLTNVTDLEDGFQGWRAHRGR